MMSKIDSRPRVDLGENCVQTKNINCVQTKNINFLKREV